MTAKRTDLAVLYKRAYFEVYSPQRQAEVSQSDPRLIASATYLAEHMHEVPVLIIPCVEAAWPRARDQEPMPVFCLPPGRSCWRSVLAEWAQPGRLSISAMSRKQRRY